MPRAIFLSRQEAELLTDLLMLTDEWPAKEIDVQLRKQWGMSSREQELEAKGKTLAQVRQDFANKFAKTSGEN